jgi:hypothetical protein
MLALVAHVCVSFITADAEAHESQADADAAPVPMQVAGPTPPRLSAGGCSEKAHNMRVNSD